jgi:putative phage-type endonuclease
MEIIKDVEQGSLEWLNMRLGKVTASKVKDVLTNGKGGAISKTAETYMMDLLSELLTGQSKPFFENDAMRWGTETEPQARAMYELMNDCEVEQVAFVKHSEFVGVSPDGMVGDDGLIEIKCPTTTTQLKRALSDSYSSDYKAQIQMQLWVTGRKWCDFVSFDPRLTCSASYLVERVYVDQEFTANMVEKINIFVQKLIELKTQFESE